MANIGYQRNTGRISWRENRSFWIPSASIIAFNTPTKNLFR
ncbi:hypothetical protein [Flavobacterium sp. LC2016-23]|nr:hypothetical protein [Flavobacterium sp. LC2016-23]